MHFNLPCKSEGKVSKFYLMQHADLEQTSLTHEQTLLPVSFREDVMDFDIKLVTDKDLNTQPIFPNSKKQKLSEQGREHSNQFL
ncbi:unnamed protein product [Sphagnum troendelagicum]|uniref:Uncharacterized protein n=1 Tax=Sphagnum troendelagicum TaxID=128251 RepID=A0ABP0U1W8_9BRYO